MKALCIGALVMVTSGLVLAILIVVAHVALVLIDGTIPT